MHERERWRMILGAIKNRAVVTVRELIVQTGASPATLRRDLAKLEETGQIKRVHGGVEALTFGYTAPTLETRAFEESQTVRAASKRAIGRAAGGAVSGQRVNHHQRRHHHLSDGRFPARPQNANPHQLVSDCRSLVRREREPYHDAGRRIYREQGIVLSPFDGDASQHYTASKMFMSCFSFGPLGVIEGDALIARAEAKLLGRAGQLIVLADSSKFETRGSMAVCPLSRVHTLITDDDAPDAVLDMSGNRA